MNKVLVFGMVLFDSINGKNYIGGPPLNVTLHMARQGFPSIFISSVGNDELGVIAKSVLKEEGVSAEYVKTDLHETGKAVAVIDDNGIPAFNIKKDVAYDYITLEKEELDRLSHEYFDMLYFGTVEQRGAVTSETLKKILSRVKFKNIFYDINLRKGHFTREVIDFSLNNTSIFKLNDEEVMMLDRIFGLDLNDEKRIVDWLFNTYSIDVIVITRGRQGASVFTRISIHDIDGIKIEVKDTVGSGDAFSAGFITEYLKSGDVVAAAKKGNGLGAYVAAHSGAVPGLEKSKTKAKVAK